MTANNLNPILIIGAGLSGIAVGRLLTNNGIANIVFEASPPERSQGFAISLHDWGYSPLLEALGGLSLRSLTKAVAPDRLLGGSGWVDLAMRDNTTREVLVGPDADARLAVMRANCNALRAWMADYSEEELDMRHGHRLKSIFGSIGNMTIVFENGAEYHGSLVIAADGVHSTVRAQILPHIVPDIVPVVVYYGDFQISRAEFDRTIRPLSGNTNILAGVGDGFNTPITIYNIGQTQVHLDWSYSRPACGDNNPLFRRASEKRDQTHELLQALLDEISSLKLADPWARYLNPETIRHHSVVHWISRCVNMTTDDTRRAARQGVVFVRDAWHAMPIFGGEGGNHALLDSVELAAAIISHSGLGAAVAAYHDGASPRSQEAVHRSRSRFYVLHQLIAEWRELAEKRAALTVK